jgi:hypothetical protein
MVITRLWYSLNIGSIPLEGLGVYMKLPDAKRHYIVSMTKSVLRIVGYIFLFSFSPIAGTILVLSEVLGILEENV